MPAAVAVPVSLAGVLAASVGTRFTWSAVYLTLAGSVVTALALLAQDRRRLLPVGALLLAAASWVRLWDVGVRDPEPYTLPSATLLVAAGLWHLRRSRAAGSLVALGPGLGLALVPSLLWALAGEPGPRALAPRPRLPRAGAGGRARGIDRAPGLGGGRRGRAGGPPRRAVRRGHGAHVGADRSAGRAAHSRRSVTWEQRLQDTRRLVGYVRGLR